MALSNTKIATITYDFSVDGGLVSDITPALNEHIPTGAVILKCLGAVETTVTSGGSPTMALKVGAVTFATATACDLAAPLNVAFGAGTGTTVAAGGNVVCTVATAAITAGKINIIIEYAY